MIKKSLHLLKNNTVIILFYAIYLVVMFLIVFTLYPKDMNQFNSMNPNSFDFAAYFNAMAKIFFASILMYACGILFLSGFGCMISEVVLEGKTKATSFLPGISKFFVRVLLASLLLIAFYIGFSIVLSIIIIPITFIMLAYGNMATLIITLIAAVAVIFTIPFIILWFPSIFIDDAGVIQGLINGAKVGVKNYLKLVFVLFVMYLPIFAYIIVNFDSMSKGVIYTPSYFIMCILAAIISIVAIPIIFIMYKENRPRLYNQFQK